MDRIDDLLRRIRDPRGCHELLLAASAGDARGVARQLAAVLSFLPAVHRELGEEPGRLAAVGELVRRVGVLELLLLNLAGQSRSPSKGESAHATRAPGARRRDPARAGRIRNVGRMALL
jgi:hypothetical protein